jgi:hypothetical protein
VDRVQIQHVGAQALHMVQQARGRARQVAAPEIEFVRAQLLVGQVGAGLGRLGPGTQDLGRGVERALGLDVGRRREAIDQHLIDDGAVAPVAFAVFIDAGLRCKIRSGHERGERELLHHPS